MINYSRMQVRGSAILARLRYIQSRWGKRVSDEAEGQLKAETGGLMVMAHLWYPREIYRTLEATARSKESSLARFSCSEMGAHEAKYLLTGQYAYLVRKNPEDMASSLPVLFKHLYQDMKAQCESKGEGQISCTVDGEGFNFQDRNTYAGFLEMALAMSGAPNPQVQQSMLVKGVCYQIRWTERRDATWRSVVKITGESAIIESRSRVQKMGADMGFRPVEIVGIATCISELARNIVNYAVEGTITIEDARREEGRCIRLLAEDKGPGIPNLEQVMAGLHKSQKGMGRGLMAIKRLADGFNVNTSPEVGTTVEVIKYLRR